MIKGVRQVKVLVMEFSLWSDEDVTINYKRID